MSIKIRCAKYYDARPIVAIYNYFIKNSLAAYSATQVDNAYFKKVRKSTQGFPFFVVESDKKVIGYGYGRPYNYLDTCKNTATITYFILPEFTGIGIGTKLFNLIIDKLHKKNMNNIIVNISSVNQQSINFHKKMGFIECGKFRKMGIKNGQIFDMLWMQKFI